MSRFGDTVLKTEKDLFFFSQKLDILKSCIFTSNLVYTAFLSLLVEAFTLNKALSIKFTTLHFKLVFAFRQFENTIHFDFLAAIDESRLSIKESLVKRE
jgi:hypothetical protein